jgi:tetratricopeptide (TPR) repeat protein
MSTPRGVSNVYSEYIFSKLDQADLFIDEDNDEEAIEIYTEVIVTYPDEPYAYARRGWVLMRQKKHELAIQDFTVALNKVPDAKNTLWLRAQSYDFIGKLDEAIEDYQKYIDLEPKDREAYFKIGLIYEYIKDYKNALINYKQANMLKHSDNLDEKIKYLSTVV